MSIADASLTEAPAQRRAKIVATLGPASNTEAVVRDLVRAGVDVIRLNFSHGTHERKLAVIKLIRKVSRDERKPLCIMGDLQGPKIRTARAEGPSARAAQGRRTPHHHAARCSRNRFAGGHHL